MTVWVDPARRGGEPCVIGTAIPTAQVAEAVWSGHGDEYTDPKLYDLKEREVLVACWFEVRYGQDKRLRPMRRAWEQWSSLASETLWHKDGVTPWPPLQRAEVR